MKNKILGVFTAALVLFSGCSAPIASPEEEVKTIVGGESIIPLNAKKNVWIINKISMVDGTSKVDYVFARKNPDGSTSRLFVSNLLIPSSSDPTSVRYSPYFMKVFEDSNGDDARIDYVTCYVKDKYCRDGSVGVNIHIPPGGMEVDPSVSSEDTSEQK